MEEGLKRTASGRMLKKASSFVLASLRGSTYHRGTLRPVACCGRAGGFFEHPIVYAGVSLTSALFLKNLLGVGR
jgi:hypothetical protein